MLNGTDFLIKIVGSRKNQIEFMKRLEAHQPDTWYRGQELGRDWMILEGQTNTWMNKMFIPQTFYYSLYDTKLLDLKVEIFAKTGMSETQEHYIFDHGNAVCQKEVKWTIIYWNAEENPNFDIFKKEIVENPDNSYETYDFLSSLGIKEEDFDEDGFAEYGGFCPWKFTI